MSAPHCIAFGQLSWNGRERRSDRYGTVRIYHNASPNEGRSAGPEPVLGDHLGKRGRLIAEIVQTRRSEHIGDLFRGIFPSRPEVGDRIVLGEGTLFIEYDELRLPHIGLRPADGRESDWLDPRALYRAHQQTVRLFFEEVVGDG